MYTPILLLSLVVCGDGPQVAVVGPPSKLQLICEANAYRLRQHDSLLIRVVLENPAGAGVEKIIAPQDFNGNLFLVERQEDDKWVRLRTVKEGRGPFCGDVVAMSVPPNSRVAEYIWFHKDRKAYIFDKPGKYVLRATAKADTTDLVSKPITVVVDERGKSGLSLIDRLDGFSHFSFFTLAGSLSKQLLALKKTGGNLGDIVEEYSLVQDYLQTGTIDGRQVPPKDACRLLAAKINPIHWEYLLYLLGNHYRRYFDLEGLTAVVEARPPIDASEFSHLASDLEWLRQLDEEGKLEMARTMSIERERKPEAKIKGKSQTE